MTSKNRITPGPYCYRPSHSRHIVSVDNVSICTVHRGKRAQYNGPLLAASWEMLEALEKAAEVMPLGEEYDTVTAAIALAKGETQ